MNKCNAKRADSHSSPISIRARQVFRAFALAGLIPFLHCPASNIENAGNPLESEFLVYNLLRCSGSSCASGSAGATTPAATPVFYIYTDSATVTGALGPRATTNTACANMQSVSYPTLGCTNHLAVLSYSADPVTMAAANYGVPAARALTSVSGIEVASDWGTFLSGPLTNSLQTAAVASVTPTPFYWSMTLTGGAYDGTYNCADSTDGTSSAFGSQGSITTTAGTHIRFAVNQPCDGSLNSAYLMCICWN